MIYSSLKGGLGNMMFEIAAMESFAHDNNDKACFINIESQIQYLNTETNFNPNMQHADEYRFLLTKYSHPTPTTYAHQFNVPFDYAPLQYMNGAFYDGFFQSEKWFKHNRDIVVFALRPHQNISNLIPKKYDYLLRKENTVGVHVRRGDYVKNQANHAILPLEYYLKAFTYFENANFVIFSDDIQWCKDNFKISNIDFIENEKDFVEIYLMAALDHCIIANSSFSWWGAWLNTNLGKKIIAPSIWFGPNIKHNTADIIPIDWIKL